MILLNASSQYVQISVTVSNILYLDNDTKWTDLWTYCVDGVTSNEKIWLKLYWDKSEDQFVINHILKASLA